MREEHRRREGLDDRADAVAGEHHRLAGQAVGDHAADEREADAGGCERRQHRAERQLGAVDREHRERERDGDDRIPDRRGDAAEPEQPELALVQRCKSVSQTHPFAP